MCDLFSVSRNQADTRTLLVGEYSISIVFFFINRLACRRCWGPALLASVAREIGFGLSPIFP